MRPASHAARSGLLRAAAVVAVVAAAGCAAPTGDADTVLVLAAASLGGVFAEMESAFEQAHPDLDVELSFAGSSSLRVQLEQGAPADVIALADPLIMDALQAGDLVADAEVFARNSMSMVVPAANPAEVTAIGDLERDDLVVGVCAAQVPCGRYAEEMFALFGVEASVDTREPDVGSLAAKVASGEIDAAVVYATDVAASNGRLLEIDLPTESDVVARYPIAVTSESERPDDARRFVDFVRSDAGQAILAAAGFGAP